MDVVGWVVLVAGAGVIVFLGDLVLKRLLGQRSRVLPHESAEAQAHQQATRGQLDGGGYGP